MVWKYELELVWSRGVGGGARDRAGGGGGARELGVCPDLRHNYIDMGEG